MLFRSSEGTTNRVRLQEDKFLTMEIPLPPLDEQRRIVSRIEHLSAKIEEARRLRQQAAKESEALALSCAEATFQKMAKRYGVASLGEVCISITDGDHITPPFVEDGVRFIFVGNVSSGRLHFRSEERRVGKECRL